MKLPNSVKNWITAIGAALAIFSAVIIVILAIFAYYFIPESPYLGLFIYLIIPAFLVLGLLMIPVGMYIQHIKDKKRTSKDSEAWWPKLDLNDKKHRNATFIFLTSTLIFIVGSAIGSYQAYHYSESVSFCGTLCHKVMEPEYVAYQHSSHARVACVECHVGTGASWYVKSKMSGLYQVYAVLTNIYPRPIPTPVRSLRPARETCEKCHWPQKFYAQKLVVQRHFIADSVSTQWDIAMQMKIGPTMSGLGLSEGIHWHINPDVKIEYIANTDTRESIPWVKYTNLKTGEVNIYNDEENTLDKKGMDTLPTRLMDCMDCHNRPSHKYQPPARFIDNELLTGNIPSDLPYVKFVTMRFLKEPFTDKDTAIMYLRDSINYYYKTNLPEVYKTRKSQIEKTIAGVTKSFSNNVFPNMRVTWEAYPDHIGHLETNGCFRCHSGTHKTNKGRVISKDCNLCHSIVAQGKPSEWQMGNIQDKLEFKHPKDIGDVWKTSFCSECHSALY
jgi:nitrate/TMAO reductase-like tetraheme cytochrome c subunit